MCIFQDMLDELNRGSAQSEKVKHNMRLFQTEVTAIEEINKQLSNSLAVIETDTEKLGKQWEYLKKIMMN